MRLILPALLAVLLLSACMTADFNPDTGKATFGIEPVASASSVQEVADMSKDYADEIADAVAGMAERLNDDIAAAKIEAAKEVADARKEVFDLNQLFQQEWFWVLLGSLGLGGAGTVAARRKIQKAREELPPEYEDVTEKSEA